jgi:hypothetical protein
MLEFLTAGVVGTITGIIGNAITGIFNYKTQKLKNTHDVAMAKLDMEHLKVEAEANIKVTKARVEGEVELAEVDAMKNSYSMLSSNLFDKAYMKYIMERKWLSWCAVPITLMFALVDFLKHLARPALTYYLVGASTWITILCWKLMDGVTLTGTEAYDLFKLVVMTVIYLTASCVGWWFGDRLNSEDLVQGLRF